VTHYLALLGHQPHISRAELCAALSDIDIDEASSLPIAFFSTKVDIDERFLALLGGTQLIARKISSNNTTLKDVPMLLQTELPHGKGKVTFSMRAFGLPPTVVRSLYREAKDALRRTGMPSRYIGNERQPALAAQLIDEGVVHGAKGAELVIAKTRGNLWIGRTIAVHDTHAYSKRDVEKPVRDTQTGLLPPKLAQTLLNFAQYLVRDKKENVPLTIFDPFCGSGVIPIETMLRGWNIIGSDIAKKAVTGSTKNVDWARKEFSIPKSVTSEFFVHDATKAFPSTSSVDVIVTETSLGPALKKKPTPREAKQYAKDAGVLASHFIKNAAKTMRGVPIVATLPVWYGLSEPLFLDAFFEHAMKAGYKPTLPAGVTASTDKRPSLVYRRPDQFVGREIVMLASS
jgi:tRNA G10  N-methylase Trm11